MALMAMAFMATAPGKPLRAADDGRWVRVSAGSLSIYAQADNAQGAAAEAMPILQMFSELRAVLSEASAFSAKEAVPLRIIAFHSEKQFDQYRLNAGSCAFYQQTQRSEYIVLQDLLPALRDVSAHEFTHFLLAHSGMTLPLWLNEGLADFYSTFRVSAGQVTLGGSVAGRLPVLRRTQWLPLDALFEVSTASSYYSDPQKMTLFYSESWALTHMLLTSPGYAPRFGVFLKSLKDGRGSKESAQLAYGQTPDEIQDELRRYLDRQHLPLTEVAFQRPQPVVSAAVAISDAEMKLALNELIPNNSAEIAVESAAEEESLGYLALKQGKEQEARTHFQLAIDRHSDDPNVFFYLAHLDHEAGAPSSEVLPLLDRALALQPDLPDARLELALLAAKDGDFGRALAALEKLEAPRPESAFAAVYTKAFCYAHLEKLTEARAAAKRAEGMARNEHDDAQVRGLMDFIEQEAQFVGSERKP